MSAHLNDNTLLKNQAYINGQWTDSDDGQTFDVRDPASGEIIASVARCGATETARAIKSAQTAQDSWKKTTSKERFAMLMAWHDLMQDNIDDLAYILTKEQGKPLLEARGEIAYGANYVRWFAEEAKRIYGDTLPSPSADQRLVVIKQPIGVVGCITPWNFPNAMLARKIAPALAAGNTVVCKPANETPLSALAMAELAHRAGIPAGVINMVMGDTPAIGEEITSNPVVRKLTFTGSTSVGKKLSADSARTMKRISMELGGNAPFIVFADADIDKAIDGVMASKFRNAGQTCVCTNRIFVQSEIHDEFVKRLSDAVARLSIGSGLSDGVDIGPLINQRAADNVRGLIEDSVNAGARSYAPSKDSLPGSCYVAPTVLSGVTPDMRIVSEEIFGPVAVVLKFETEDDVIAMANDTPFGLAAYFYAREIGRVWRVFEALEYGMVGINVGNMSNEMAPFGGIKDSGQGREGSKYGLDGYLEIKSLCIGGITS